MKNLMPSMFAILLSFYMQAQNKNASTVTKTTTTTIKNDKGERKIVKNEEIKELQNIELKAVPNNTLNTEMKDSPVQVTSTTRISVDGVEKIVDVDRSAYYSFNNKKYQVAADKSGYTVTSPNNNEFSRMRKTANNTYIYRNNDKFSIGHFDDTGNLVLETYDEKTDSIIVEVFNLQK